MLLLGALCPVPSGFAVVSSWRGVVRHIEDVDTVAIFAGLCSVVFSIFVDSDASWVRDGEGVGPCVLTWVQGDP